MLLKILIIFFIPIYCFSYNFEVFELIGDNVRLRAEPNTNAIKISELFKGNIVDSISITNFSNDKYPWYKVNYLTNVGWIYGKYLSKIKITYNQNKLINKIYKTTGYGYPNSPDIEINESNYQKYKMNLDNYKSEKNSDKLFELFYLSFEMNKLDECFNYLELSYQFDSFKTKFYKTFENYWYGEFYSKKGEQNKAYTYFVKNNDLYFIYKIKAEIYRTQKEYQLAEIFYLLAQNVTLYELENDLPFKELIAMYSDLKNKDLTTFYIKYYINFLKKNSIIGHVNGTPIINNDKKNEIENYQKMIDSL